MKKLENQMWYLGPELIPLCLFSEKPTVDEKRNIASAMLQCGDNWSVQEIKLQQQDMDNVQLHQLVTASSSSALHLLGVDTAFLLQDPETWSDNPAFLNGRLNIDSIKVVNDAAERSVATMTSFNDSITKMRLRCRN